MSDVRILLTGLIALARRRKGATRRAGVMDAILVKPVMRMAGKRTVDITTMRFWFKMMTLSMLGMVLIYAGIMLVVEGCSAVMIDASDARVEAHAVLGAIVYAAIGHLFFDLRRLRYAH